MVDTHRHTYLFLVDGNPVCGCEPLVSLDVIDPVLEVSVTFCEIHLKKTPMHFPNFFLTAE